MIERSDPALSAGHCETATCSPRSSLDYELSRRGPDHRPPGSTHPRNPQTRRDNQASSTPTTQIIPSERSPNSSQDQSSDYSRIRIRAFQTRPDTSQRPGQDTERDARTAAGRSGTAANADWRHRWENEKSGVRPPELWVKITIEVDQAILIL